MTALLGLCGAAAFLVTLVVLGGNRRPTPTPSPPTPAPPAPPDIEYLILAELDRRRREQEIAEGRAKVNAIFDQWFATSPGEPSPVSPPRPKA